jgi:hypothetical protein
MTCTVPTDVEQISRKNKRSSSDSPRGSDRDASAAGPRVAAERPYKKPYRKFSGPRTGAEGSYRRSSEPAGTDTERPYKKPYRKFSGPRTGAEGSYRRSSEPGVTSERFYRNAPRKPYRKSSNNLVGVKTKERGF